MAAQCACIVYLLSTNLMLEAHERALGVIEAGGAVRVQLPHRHALPALDAHTRPVQRQTSAVQLTANIFSNMLNIFNYPHPVVLTWPSLHA